MSLKSEIALLLLASSFFFTSCGGGGSTAPTQPSGQPPIVTPPGPQSTSESTILISAYMSIAHANMITTFESAEQSLDRSLATQGSYLSGRHIIEYENNLSGHIQTFLDSSLAYINEVRKTKAIDKATINAYFTD